MWTHNNWLKPVEIFLTFLLMSLLSLLCLFIYTWNIDLHIWTSTSNNITEEQSIDTIWEHIKESIVDTTQKLNNGLVEIAAEKENKLIKEQIVEKIEPQEPEKTQKNNLIKEEPVIIEKEVDILPSAVNLDIPFYAQAPEWNRSLPWKEACEEASLILAAAYLEDRTLTLDQFKTSIHEMVALQKVIYNNYIDTDMEQTAAIFDNYYGSGNTKLIDNPTIEQLKEELALWNPIIAPFAGKELWNIYYSNGWPRYHVLVITGYDETHFYTNDVGTKRWENFPYNHSIIMNALHDLVPVWQGDINTWKKRVLVLQKNK